MYAWPAIFETEGNAINVTFPDVPGAITCGFSEEQAIEYAEDVLVLMLNEYMRERKPLPRPRARRGRNIRSVRLPAIVQAKLALYEAMLEAGTRNADLARRPGWQKNQVERLMSLRHASPMDQIEAALRAVGKTINIAVHDAA